MFEHQLFGSQFCLGQIEKEKDQKDIENDLKSKLTI